MTSGRRRPSAAAPHNPALAAGLAAELACLRAAYASSGGAGAHPGGGAGALFEEVEKEEAEVEVQPPPADTPPTPPPTTRPPPDPALLAAIQYRKGKLSLGAAALARRGRSEEK